MEKKYQVFISSTYVDLQKERQEVMNALLELDCIPSGMELFPATNEEQWDLIKDVIDESDYYVLILGGRYGSVGNDGMGYTEKEYRYALEIKKPIIAFLHKSPEDLPKKYTEEKEEGQKRFKEFRDLIQAKMCKYWLSPEELGSVVSRSLIKLQKKHPGTGWVKGDLIPSKEASLEILELRKEIELLENKLESARTEAPEGTKKLAQGTDEFIIAYDFSIYSNYKWHKFDTVAKYTWNEIFYQLSPLMIDEANDTKLKESLNMMLDTYEREELESKEEYKDYKIERFKIAEEDFQTIKVQLRALGLMKKNEKNRSVKDTGTYWSLTLYGDSIMNKLRAIEKNT
ncbi:MAG: hypothetical protein CL623_11430 [Arcobacter sp.]|nr:hypothetical protein [Arcobacter sp.]|tara:strand:+ start:8500 stop:9528 length:1029 start_codon:yes stop_codon:yes gene_type:complete